MKKFISIMVIMFLVIILAAGCGSASTSANGGHGELLGKYSGSGGTIEFLPDSQIKVEFSKDYVWLVNSGTKNNTTYDYNFLTDKRKIVSYDKATYLSFKTVGKKTSFIMHPCKASQDRVILHPDRVNEIVFEKAE